MRNQHTQNLRSGKRLNALYTVSALALSIFTGCFLVNAQLAYAQTSVPPTARQALQLPQFASRLAGAQQRGPQATYKHPSMRGGPNGSLPNDQILYDNGPINGTTDAWTINFGFVVSDTFSLADHTNIRSMSFGAWLFPGDVLQSVEVLIGTAEFGGDIAEQVVSLTQSNCSGNQYGFNVCVASGNFAPVDLQGRTYWITLQNAVVNNGDPVYWDENSGPSMASGSSIGTIPSEAFTIVGDGGCTCCGPPRHVSTPAQSAAPPSSPAQGYRVLYDFTGGVDGAYPEAGLVVDAAGNLYGTASGGGPSGNGTVFKLSPNGSDWRFTALYSFSSPDGSGPDSKLALGPDGTVYGTTPAGGSGNGTLFRLSPPGRIVPNATTNWIERMLYPFSGGSEGGSPHGDIVVDNHGNVFGSAAVGGAYTYGTAYQLTSGGIQVLHDFGSFPGDGVAPQGVIKGPDGLYGFTASGGGSDGGTIYTLAGGYRVLHSFAPYSPGRTPLSLASDQAGNLFSTVTVPRVLSCTPGFGFVVGLSPPDWDPQVLAGFDSYGGYGSTVPSWVSADAAGNVYGTTDDFGAYDLGTIFKLECCWTYTSLHDFAGFPSDGARPSASPIVDAHGNIFGTTSSGGAYGYGVVWEISP